MFGRLFQVAHGLAGYRIGPLAEVDQTDARTVRPLRRF